MSMALVKFEEGTLNIDAAVIGRGLNIEPSLVQGRMREGKITVLSERGVEAKKISGPPPWARPAWLHF